MLGPVRDAGVGSSLRGRRAGKHALLPGPRPLPSPWKRSGHGGRDGGSVWVAGRFRGAGMRRVAQAEVSSPCHLFRRSQPGAHSERNGLGDNARMSCRPNRVAGRWTIDRLPTRVVRPSIPVPPVPHRGRAGNGTPTTPHDMSAYLQPLASLGSQRNRALRKRCRAELMWLIHDYGPAPFGDTPVTAVTVTSASGAPCPLPDVPNEERVRVGREGAASGRRVTAGGREKDNGGVCPGER